MSGHRKFEISKYIVSICILQILFVNCGESFESHNVELSSTLSSENNAVPNDSSSTSSNKEETPTVANLPSEESNESESSVKPAVKAPTSPANPTAETPKPAVAPVSLANGKFPATSKAFLKGQDGVADKDPLKSAKPLAVGDYYIETFGTKMTRVSKDGIRHSYSKRQAFNINETFYVMSKGIYNVDDNSFHKKSPVSTFFVWSNIDKNIMYGMTNSSRSFSKANIATNKQEVLKTFPGYDKCKIGHGEGNISIDDRYILFSCIKGKKITLISFDIKEKKVLGTLNAPPLFNWAGFSQSGKYILVENNGSGQQDGEYLMVYDKNLKNPNKIADGSNHGDLSIDKNGDDVYVMISNTYISSLRLKDGQKKNIVGSSSNQARHGHISCRSILRPGYCYFSSYHSGTVGSVNINTGEISNWGYHRTYAKNDYNAESKGSVSPSGKRFIVTSNWFGKSSVGDYIIEFLK